MAARWNQERYNKWDEETHIPVEVMTIVNAVCEKIGMCVEEEIVLFRNRWNEP